MEELDEKCIICGKEETHSLWIYIWEGKSGHACEKCGNWFHDIGDYLIDKAADAMRGKAIDVMQTKEKFGEWRIYAIYDTDEKAKFAKDIRDMYNRLFPQFAWEW